MEAAHGDEKPRTSTRERVTLMAALAGWLEEVTGADRTPEVRDLGGPTKGGLSSDTLLVDLAWTADGRRHERAVVVRLPPPPDAWPVFESYDLGRQAAAMTAVRRGSGVPVPEVLWYEADSAPLGAPFLVMERIEGVAAPDYWPYTWEGWVVELSPDDRRAVADASIDLLAGIHAVSLDAELTEALEMTEYRGSPLRRHFESERARYDWAREGRRFPTIERGIAVLEDHWPARESEARISWGDARVGNILFAGTTPTAVLDWEMVALGPPALDLAWMVFFAESFQRSAERRGLPGIPGFQARDTALGRYEQVSGTTVDDFDWHLCYAAVREAIVSLRTMGRAVHFGEMPVPDHPEGLIRDREHVVELTDALERI